MPRCKAPTAKGGRCKRQAVKREYCAEHLEMAGGELQARLAERVAEQPQHRETPGHEIQRLEPVWGVSEDTPFWNYLLWDAHGSGEVRKVGHSPAHMKRERDEGKDVTTAMADGRAFHACVLEPDTEWPRYHRLADGLDRRSKEYKAAVVEHGKDFVLRDIEYDACLGGRDRLRQHSRLRRLLDNGRAEVSFAWHDPDTGLPMKGRADWVSEGIVGGAVLDLKRTTDAREDAFKKIAARLGYPTQGAHYTSGLLECGVEAKHYVAVACEVEPPYEPIVYRVSEKDMMVALAEWDALKRLLAWCVEHDTWPGYPEHVHVLHMGQWWEAGVQDRVAGINEFLEGKE